MEPKVQGEVAGDIRKSIGNQGLEFRELQTPKSLESDPQKMWEM